MKHFTLAIFCLLLVCKLSGQQDVISSSLSDIYVVYNPAMAGIGSLGQGQIDLSYRDQWYDVDGSPKTIFLNIEKNFSYDRMGLGLVIDRESIGIDSRTDALFSYSYKLPFDKSDLILGIRGAFAFFQSDFDKINSSQTPDPIYNQGVNQFSVASIGLGTFYRTQRYYAGFSVPSIVAFSNNKDSFKEPHFYLYAGGLVGPDYIDFQVEPSLLIKYQVAAPIQATAAINFWFTEGFALSTRYRSQESLGLGLRYYPQDRFKIMMNYDFGIGRFAQSGTANSWEIGLGYRFSANTHPYAFSTLYK